MNEPTSADDYETRILQALRNADPHVLDERKRAFDGVVYLSQCRLFREYVRLDDFETVLAGAHAAYGWMPRILRSVDGDAVTALAARLEGFRGMSHPATALRAFQLFDNDEREQACRFVNGSVTGSSKFLHFLSPRSFPIWDSRIARVLRTRPSETTRVSNYVAYWEALARCIEKPEAQQVAQVLGGDASPLRQVEYALYLLGPRDED